MNDDAHLRGQTQDLLHQLLSLRRLLKEQLDDGGQQSELDLLIKAHTLILLLSSGYNASQTPLSHPPDGRRERAKSGNSQTGV